MNSFNRAAEHRQSQSQEEKAHTADSPFTQEYKIFGKTVNLWMEHPP
jgi:hypothetical protein